jgi:outer membrane receptor for ferrienterochelin and colicins
MRSTTGHLLAIVSFAAACNPQGLRARDDGAGVKAAVNAARALDQEGVRSFRESRYRDAIAYFQAAYRSGGPSSELWNIARSKERMDDAEGAAESIDAYLALKDLSPQDRAEAEREAQALRARPSALTVMTEPPGATVWVDGKPAGATPLSVEVHGGAHTLTIHRDGYAAETRAVQPRFGRAVIVTLDLARSDK